MKQDYLNANIDNKEDDPTVDLNFRESYDPDRIAENGFAIVGTEPLSIPRRAVCFLCGSAGMEKVNRYSLFFWKLLKHNLSLWLILVNSLCFLLRTLSQVLC